MNPNQLANWKVFVVSMLYDFISPLSAGDLNVKEVVYSEITEVDNKYLSMLIIVNNHAVAAGFFSLFFLLLNHLA